MFEIHSICLQHYQVVFVVIVLDKTWKQIHKTAKDNNNEGENDWLQSQKKKPMRFNSPTVVSVIVLDFPKFNVMDVMSVCLSVYCTRWACSRQYPWQNIDRLAWWHFFFIYFLGSVRVCALHPWITNAILYYFVIIITIIVSCNIEF